MDYSTIIWYLAIMAAAVLALIVLTNIFTQVIKKVVNKEEFPAQAIVFVVAEILTFLTMAVVCAIIGVQILWYFWIIAFVVGVLVTYGAIFGYDNLYSQIFEALKNLINAIFKIKQKE